MEKYFEILKNTPQYEIAHKLFHYKDKWISPEVQADLKESLGFDPDKKVLMWPHRLEVNNVPASELRDQFCANRTRSGRIQAKKKSPINKAFLEVVKKHNLEYYETFDLVVSLGNGTKELFCVFDAFYPINDGFRYITQTKVNLDDEVLDFLRACDYLKEIDPEEMLKLRIAQETV